MFDYTNSDVKKYIDVEDGLKRIRDNKKLYIRMLKMVLASEEFGKLKAALDADDYDNGEKAAHSIKGITGNLSLPALFNTSVDLMQQLKTGPADPKTAADFWEYWDITEKYINEVINTLSE